MLSPHLDTCMFTLCGNKRGKETSEKGDVLSFFISPSLSFKCEEVFQLRQLSPFCKLHLPFYASPFIFHFILHPSSLHPSFFLGLVAFLSSFILRYPFLLNLSFKPSPSLYFSILHPRLYLRFARLNKVLHVDALDSVTKLLLNPNFFTYSFPHPVSILIFSYFSYFSPLYFSTVSISSLPCYVCFLPFLLSTLHNPYLSLPSHEPQIQV